MKLAKHPTYPEMYYVEWPDGSRSDDFYNKSRANDFCCRIAETTARREREGAAEPLGQPVRAFK